MKTKQQPPDEGGTKKRGRKSKADGGRKNGQGTLQKHGKNWRAVWIVDGVTFRRSTGTANKNEAAELLDAWTAPYRIKADAAATAREARKAWRTGNAPAAAAVAEVAKERRAAAGREAVPLETAWEKFSRKRPEVEASTARTDAYRWGTFLDWMRAKRPAVHALADIDQDAAEEFLEEIKSKHSAKTHNEYRALLSKVWKVLDDAAGLDGFNPWRKVAALDAKSKMHVRRELTVEELAAVYAATKGELRTLFAIGIYTGLRLGDAVRLDWGAVDMVRGFISVVPHKTKGTGTRVKIAISGVLRGLLEKTPPRHRRGSVLPKLAADYGDGEGSMRVVRKIQAVFRDAGIETQSATRRKNADGTARKAVDVGFHSLRHTYVSLCANAGIPLATVQKIVGHTSTAMTEHYFHVSDDSLREATAALPDVTAAATTLRVPAESVEDAEIVEGAGSVAEALAALREAAEKLTRAKPTAREWKEAAAILADAKRRA